MRQLPCSHAFHAQCIDAWLCQYDRSCPSCRAVVAPHASDAAAAGEERVGTSQERAWDNYVAMRASGALAAITRLNEMERDAEHRRAEQADREWRASSMVMVGML